MYPLPEDITEATKNIEVFNLGYGEILGRYKTASEKVSPGSPGQASEELSCCGVALTGAIPVN